MAVRIEIPALPAAAGMRTTPGRVVAVSAAMAGLFALTTLLNNAYHNHRARLARELFESGERLAGAGGLRPAIERYQDALELDRGNTRYQLSLALALARLEQADEAATYLDQVLRADPTNAPANLALARISARRGHFEAAVTNYQRAIYGYWPREPEKQRLAADFELVDLLARHGVGKQVVAQLLLTDEHARAEPEVRKRIAALLILNGSPAEAAAICEDVLRANPRDAGAHAGLGQALLAMDRYREARAALREAFRLNPADEASRRGYELAAGVIVLDPSMPGLDEAERYHRGVRLLKLTLDAVQQCAAARPSEDLLAAVRAQIARRVRRSRYQETTDENLRAARRLWAARVAGCGADRNSGPLPRVMERVVE